jgi:hypothetical protein
MSEKISGNIRMILLSQFCVAVTVNSVYMETLLQTPVMIDLKCPSDKQDWLFILLLFIRESNCSET